MNLKETSLFQVASQRLQWLSERQRVISENIANADVAEYRAREVESFESFVTSSSKAQAGYQAQVVEAKASWGEDLTGNNVVLEEQIMEASSNAGQYRVAANLYRKAHEMLISVATRR
ncbi:MAG: flagellar basal body rod protein [Rhodobacteraceae bacterium]|nr:flagellar basal body rod protein [Paracoccaceae bacterium]